jgi:hypothetical protein
MAGSPIQRVGLGWQHATDRQCVTSVQVLGHEMAAIANRGFRCLRLTFRAPASTAPGDGCCLFAVSGGRISPCSGAGGDARRTGSVLRPCTSSYTKWQRTRIAANGHGRQRPTFRAPAFTVTGVASRCLGWSHLAVIERGCRPPMDGQRITSVHVLGHEMAANVNRG